jgi:hypothetical protein
MFPLTHRTLRLGSAALSFKLSRADGRLRERDKNSSGNAEKSNTRRYFKQYARFSYIGFLFGETREAVRALHSRKACAGCASTKGDLDSSNEARKANNARFHHQQFVVCEACGEPFLPAIVIQASAVLYLHDIRSSFFVAARPDIFHIWKADGVHP